MFHKCFVLLEDDMQSFTDKHNCSFLQTISSLNEPDGDRFLSDCMLNCVKLYLDQMRKKMLRRKNKQASHR